MAAFQQLLLAIGERLGFVTLQPSYEALAEAASFNGSTAGAILRLNLFNSGLLTVVKETNGTSSGSSNGIINQYNWLTNGTASLYYVRLTRTGGNQTDFRRSANETDPSALINTWIKMTDSISWNLKAVSGPSQSTDNRSIVFTLEIATGPENNPQVVEGGTGSFTFTCLTETAGTSGFN